MDDYWVEWVDDIVSLLEDIWDEFWFVLLKMVSFCWVSSRKNHRRDWMDGSKIVETVEFYEDEFFFFYFNGFFSYKIFRWTFDGYRIDKWVRKCYCPFNPRFLPNLTIFTLTSLCTIQFEYNTLNQLRPSFDLPLNFDAAVDSGSAVSDNVNFPQIQNSIHRHHRWINSIYLFDVS